MCIWGPDALSFEGNLNSKQEKRDNAIKIELKKQVTKIRVLPDSTQSNPVWIATQSTTPTHPAFRHA
jgi:hypothetical protein